MHRSLHGAACGLAIAVCSARGNAQSHMDATADTSVEKAIASPSPHTDNAAPLERAAYIRAVLRANPSLEASRQAWQAARARVHQAGAFDDPTIMVSLAPLSIGSSHADLGYEVGISQQLPWFGKRGFERATMAAEAAAAASDLQTMRVELALSALTLYDQYYVAFRSLAINQQHVALMRALQSAALSQYEAGHGSAVDALQAEAELASMERDALTLAADRDVIGAQMNALLHRSPSSALAPPVAELALHGLHDLPSQQQLEHEALMKRTEISAARQRARAQSAKIDAADRAYYPNLSVSTSYSTMWAMPPHRFMVGLGINVPLPTEQRRAAVDEARANHARYESEIARMSDLARTQVFVDSRRLKQSHAVLELLETRLLPVARDQVDAARAGFVASQTTFPVVVAAEKHLRSVELERTLAQAECDRQRAELDRALGLVPGLQNEEPRP
jgi:cobalt-zinc-cadmium efflux system outer membrane protein